MDNNNLALGSESSEINLKSFVRKVWEKKWYFVICAPLCLAIAYFYVKVTPPTYEVATSLLIDMDAKARVIGTDPNGKESIGALESEKNIFNEIARIKSFALISQTLEELKFNVSYHTKEGIKQREQYGYFPFVVVPDDAKSQLIDAVFKVEILSADEFRIHLDEKELFVQNPVTKSTREVEQELEFSGTYEFGKPVLHDYFNFTLEKPAYKVSMAEFQDIELSFSVHSLEDLTKNYIDNLEVAQSDIQASILQMVTRGGVVEKEKDFLETLTKNYIQAQLDRRKDKGSGRIGYLRSQLKSVGDSLKQAERDLERYRSRTGAIDLSATAKLTLDRIKTLETEKQQIELNSIYYQGVLESLKDSAGINTLVMPSTQGINDPVLAENLIELRKKNAERSNLALLVGKESIDREILDNQVAELKRTVVESIQNLSKSSNVRLSEKGKQINRENAKLSRLPSNERNLVGFERDSYRHTSMYNFLRQELTKTEIAFSNEMPDTQVIDAPRMQGDGPVAPQKMLIYLLGLLVGLFIPFGIIVVSNTVTEQISDIDQIERIAGVPVASSIGHFGMDKKGKILESDRWKLEESFRDLSASLQFLLPNSQNNIIGVTSTIPGEGKTFCATNLGMNFAEGGKKILLVDTDLRNPSLIEDIERIKGKGLINYLKGEIEFFNEIIYEHDEIENLHYIPTYPTDENPHKLLSSPRLRSLLTDLRDEYDYIIFDSPPVGLVSDYLLISKYFDIHLFVVRRKYSKIQYLNDVDKIKKRGNLKNMYIIFNDVKDDAFKYGYSNYEYRDSRKLKDIKKKIKK